MQPRRSVLTRVWIGRTQPPFAPPSTPRLSAGRSLTTRSKRSAQRPPGALPSSFSSAFSRAPRARVAHRPQNRVRSDDDRISRRHRGGFRCARVSHRQLRPHWQELCHCERPPFAFSGLLADLPQGERCVLRDYCRVADGSVLPDDARVSSLSLVAGCPAAFAELLPESAVETLRAVAIRASAVGEVEPQRVLENGDEPLPPDA